jgi:hypothetical protein
VKTIRWPLLLALLATAAYGGQVYKSTDANGNVVFSDRPSEKSEPVYVTVPGVGRPGNPITSPDARAAATAQAGNGQAPANAAGAPKKEKVLNAGREGRRAREKLRVPLASARADTTSRIGCTSRAPMEIVCT